jgi:polysaccharide export outer membrane protein
MTERGREFLLLAWAAAMLAASPGCHSITNDFYNDLPEGAGQKTSAAGKASSGSNTSTYGKPDGDFLVAAGGHPGLPPVPPAEPKLPERPASTGVALLFAEEDQPEEEDENPPATVLAFAQEKSEEQSSVGRSLPEVQLGPGLVTGPSDAVPTTEKIQVHSSDSTLGEDLPRPNLAVQGEVSTEMPALFPQFSCPSPDGHLPREMFKVALGPYVIEPPDILLVEATPIGFLDGSNFVEQRISGEHLVRPDGTVGLGIYGSVRVAGLTLDEARTAIEDHLKQALKIKVSPKVNVDVFAYNSKAYYIIADNAGYGQPVVRLPYTGNDTVLDAIGQIGGLPASASKKKIWIARPGPDHKIQILPVDWKGIAQDARVATNYQLFPGDRIYIQSDRLMALDGIVSKIVAPIERVLGVTFLGGQTIFRLQNMGRGAGGSTTGGI